MNGMSITGEGNGSNITSLLKKAIKDYRDEMLTGLTDEEKAEIEAKLSAYRKECLEAGMDPKSIQSAIDSYYKKLLQEYGAKFANSFDAALAGASEDGNTAQGTEGTGSGTATQTNTAKPSAANTANKSEVKTETYTDSDGTVYLVITSPSGINMKIKIGGDGESSKDMLAGVEGDGESSKDMLAGVEKARSGSAASEYEKGIDAFFDIYEHSIDTI